VTVVDLLARELRRDGARPFLTWYDDEGGARVELSVATTANWAAKIANHLSEEGIEPGDRVGVGRRPHWITAVVLLGAWTAGAHIDVSAPETLSVTYEPMGAGLSRLVAAQPDQIVVPVSASDEPALTVAARTWSHRDLAEAAQHTAAQHRLGSTSRILSTLGFGTADGIDAGLLTPLAAGGSVVLVANASAAGLPSRAQREKITQTAGVDVPNIPRLDHSFSGDS
jgi:acyl-CoA synthetase (AMP-forming)/AMP-acid ligase II